MVFLATTKMKCCRITGLGQVMNFEQNTLLQNKQQLLRLGRLNWQFSDWYVKHTNNQEEMNQGLENLVCHGFFKCLNHAELDTLLSKTRTGRAVPYHSANFCSYSSLRLRFLFSCKVSPESCCIIIRRPPAGILEEEAEVTSHPGDTYQ